jgi:hypothetical protein
LAFNPNITETCATTKFIEMGVEAVGRPVHGMLEQDGHCPVEVVFT